MNAMKSLRSIAVPFLALIIYLVPALEADELEGLLLPNPTTGGHSLSWWGELDTTYFIQHGDDLVGWDYIPDLASGADAQITYQFLTNGPRGFYKLRSSDYPTSDPWGADFDGDELSNYDELFGGLDPLSATDGNANGVPDDWELFHGFDLNIVANLSIPKGPEAPGG